MASLRRLRKNSRYDRRVYGYRTDETAHATVGIPCQTGMAAPVDYGGRCIVQLPARVVHLLHDIVHLGRRIYTGTESTAWYGLQ